MIDNNATLVHILRSRAQDEPQRLVYRFLLDGENEEVVITYRELDRQARSIAAKLQSISKEGDRALLLFPPGEDFIYAYYGCLYARVLSVPAYPPHPIRPEKALPKIRTIVDDSMPKVALGSSSLLEVVRSKNPLNAEFGGMELLASDDDTEDWSERWKQPEIKSDDIAFLQYTSGSTNQPKGVIVSHKNLRENMALIAKCYGVSRETHGVIWLPPYHDMGLIGGILQPVYSGCSVTLMSHMQFLQRPFRWLQAITRYKGTVSGGPNFAYDLCVSKIKPEEREQLDLSSWEVAFNGAEPVYHKTLEQFADYFAPCGFRYEAFLPCYGFAESTLMITGGPKEKAAGVLHLMSAGLEQDKVEISAVQTGDTRTLVSCGINMSSQEVMVVNVDTRVPCAEDEIGEIWVRGDCVTGGYWNNREETKSTFDAWPANSDHGPFVRSGDLGFVHHGELYITGRIKNLIISGGKNHYPHDIERTVEQAHPSIRPAGSAVFSVNNAESEDIIVIAELSHRHGVDFSEVRHAIRNAVSLHHGLQIYDIKLTIPGGVARTTSGKIRHFQCKKAYMAGDVKEIDRI